MIKQCNLKSFGCIFDLASYLEVASGQKRSVNLDLNSAKICSKMTCIQQRDQSAFCKSQITLKANSIHTSQFNLHTQF